MKFLAKKKLTKKQKRRRVNLLSGIIIAIFSFALGLFFGDYSFSLPNQINQWSNSITRWFSSFDRPSTGITAGNAEIHVLDVGQGASTLLQSSDGTNILIDSGRYDDESQQIISYLDEHIGIGGAIDLVIFTHNHTDHIGNGDLIFEYYDVEQVWMNGLDATTATYENVVDTILESEAEYVEPKAGDDVEIGPFFIETLHPQPNEQLDDQNDESIVTRITVNGVSMMTSGDASYYVEDEIVQNNNQLTSEILITGHHGSSDSTGRNWLNAVDPEIAVYQADLNNQYGHPHDELINRIEDKNIPLYGTAENGAITFSINENGQYDMELEYE